MFQRRKDAPKSINIDKPGIYGEVESTTFIQLDVTPTDKVTIPLFPVHQNTNGFAVIS